jgi:predicted amino acid-binding ACT domain protein
MQSRAGVTPRASSALAALGANVRRVPTFVAKHPFRVVVHEPLAEKSRRFFLETKKID